MILVNQTLTLGTLLQHRAQVLGPHLMRPPKWQAEEVGTRRFLVVDDEDKADGDGC
jgi:hypothetical protein